MVDLGLRYESILKAEKKNLSREIRNCTTTMGGKHLVRQRPTMGLSWFMMKKGKEKDEK